MTDQTSANPENAPNNLITLKVHKPQLAAFVESILGQPKAIHKIFDCDFDIDLNWLINYADLISQRIKAQNTDAVLVRFKASIFFDGNRNVDLTSLEALRAYHDRTDNISIGFVIIMTYLIQFPYKDSPEAQDITLTGRTKELTSNKKSKNNSELLLLIDRKDYSYLSTSLYVTEMTFGDDMIGLIAGHITSRFPERSSILRNVRIYTTAFLPFVSMVIGLWLASSSVDKQSVLRKKALEAFKWQFDGIGGTIETVEAKLNALYSIQLDIPEPSALGLMWMAWPLVIVVMFLAFINISTASYICVNDASSVAARRTKKSIAFWRVIIGAGLLVGMISGVLSSYLYERIFK
jgi:hypothetical protein